MSATPDQPPEKEQELDEALKETFPASDPVENDPRDPDAKRLPPAHAPGSDVKDE